MTESCGAHYNVWIDVYWTSQALKIKIAMFRELSMRPVGVSLSILYILGLSSNGTFKLSTLFDLTRGHNYCAKDAIWAATIARKIQVQLNVSHLDDNGQASLIGHNFFALFWSLVTTDHVGYICNGTRLATLDSADGRCGHPPSKDAYGQSKTGYGNRNVDTAIHTVSMALH